jgi:hypothetical protein
VRALIRSEIEMPIFALFTLLLAVFAPPPAGAASAIGAVSRIQGECTASLNDVLDALSLNSEVFLNQEISTGVGARLELTLSDQTKLTLGERAKLRLDSFVYAPAMEGAHMRAAVTGAFRFVSGRLGKLASADVAIATPVATIGVRGTDFWGGPVDNQFGVFLIEGSVTVSNPAGAVVLDQSGQGTNIAQPGAAPGAVTIWPEDKVNRAIATVTFQ